MSPKPALCEDLWRQLRSIENLRAAWQRIYANGNNSASPETREQVRRFAASSGAGLKKIQAKLLKDRYRFDPAKGISIRKPGGRGRRGIVLFRIEDRIVQRAILNVVQTIPSIQAQLEAGLNFGGIAGRNFGVPAAVERALEGCQKNEYFIRTDVRKFFDKVPRDRALDALCMHIEDARLAQLLRNAANVELSNLERIPEAERRLFPLGNEGVAQGSCLSPLICNFLLGPLDRQMSGNGIIWVRYIDDIVLFADSRKRAHAALRSARKHLDGLGLDAYDPVDDSTKADEGFTRNTPLTYLGCEILPTRVRPSVANRKKLLSRIKEICAETLANLVNEHLKMADRPTISGAMTEIRNVVRGWGNTYSFCTDDNLMRDTDRLIVAHLEVFLAQAKRRMRLLDPEQRLRALGWMPLSECKKDADDKRCRALVSSFRHTSATP